MVYLAVYPILNALFGVDLLALGIYLPMLVVEPLLIYRFGRVQETMQKAVSKGLRITLGYVLLLLLLGCVREWMWLSAARCCPWPECRQAASSCWASCAPSGAPWPSTGKIT